MKEMTGKWKVRKKKGGMKWVWKMRKVRGPALGREPITATKDKP